MRSTESFNLGAIRSKARRMGRRGSAKNPIGSLWLPRRANTDLEQGAPGIRGPRDNNRLGPTNTAPGRLVTPREMSRDGSHHKDSQDAGVAPTQPNTSDSHAIIADDGPRNRKPVPGPDVGEKPPAESEDASKDKPKPLWGPFRHAPHSEPFTFKNQLQRTILGSWINVLLVAVPAGFAVKYAGVDGKIVFAVNFIAIIPLAAMLSFATEELALRTGETLGGLINATFGNAVELIVAIIALIKNEVTVVQQSLVGSILSNLLLVMGCCFLAGGATRRVQYFNKTVAQTAASLLALAVSAVIVPTIFDQLVSDNSHNAEMSHGVAVIVLAVYAAYLFFQLKTHSKVFSEESPKAETVSWRHSQDARGALARAAGAMAQHASAGRWNDSEGHEVFSHMQAQAEEEDEEDEEATLSVPVALATLLSVTVLVGFCSEFMVDGIEPVTQAGLSKEFVGLILLPIVGNACEHATAVTVAMKDKMDLAIGVAVGSSMQVALFLIPLLVIIGWGLGNTAMTLAFDGFQVVVMFVAVLLTNYLIADGESHWLEGFLLICLYLIIAVCSYWYPQSQ